MRGGRDVARGIGKTAARGPIFLIEVYRNMISPLRPASCRFIPTCSQYAVEVLKEYGVVQGSWFVVARLIKCGPWHLGGWDPIPERLPESPICWADFDDATNAKGESLV